MAKAWITDRAKHAAYRKALAKWKADVKDGKTKRNPPGRWRVGWIDPTGKDCFKTFQTLPPAEEHKRDTEKTLNDATAVYIDPKAKKVAFTTVAESWYKARTPKWKPRTKTLYRNILDGYVLPKFGTTPIGHIRFEECASWLSSLFEKPGLTGSDKRTIGASRLGSIYRVLSGVLAWGVRCGNIPVNPIKGLDTLPDKAPPKRIYLNHSQIDALADAVGALETAWGTPRPKRDDYKVLVYVLAYCGLRIGEVMALRVGSVDLEGGQLSVVEQFTDDDGEVLLALPKGDKTRVVGLFPFLTDLLRPLLEGRDDEEFIFTSPEDKPLRAPNFRNRIFNPAVKAAKLPTAITPHSLRHTFASLSVAAGADVKTLQSAMGHASAAMTLDTYADLFPARVGEVADALGKHRDVALAA